MRITTRHVVMVALFTALTVIGTMIKIPLPTGAFVHLGNAVLLLAVLFLGYVKGSLAGGLGFAIFDVLNGYAIEAPYFIVESFIVGAAAYGLFLLYHKNPRHIWQIIIVATGTGVVKLVMTQIKNMVRQLYLGMDFPTAFTTAIFSLPATVVNVVLTAVLVSFLYFPLKRALATIL
ncbi:ECF transporter S component [Tetragenococcus halophilus]|uniref:ECF transporter S component n=1 Tax=Tetragenococcus halophilus TaxID=51669 RepID=UPI0030C94B1F